jgi:hypothetical protein
VDEWRVEEPDYDPGAGETLERADPDGDWRLMRELFGEVHRRPPGTTASSATSRRRSRRAA